MRQFRPFLLVPVLAAVLAGCPTEPTPEPDPEITDAGTALPAKPDCTVQAQGSKYALCETSFTTEGFQRTDRYEMTGDLIPLESDQRQRGERFVVVGGLAQ